MTQVLSNSNVLPLDIAHRCFVLTLIRSRFYTSLALNTQAFLQLNSLTRVLVVNHLYLVFIMRSVYFLVSVLNDVVGHFEELRLFIITNELHRSCFAWSADADGMLNAVLGCNLIHLCEK